MVARFTDLAVDALADYLATNYATYLRAVETELSLSANALPTPASGDYVRADMPFDNRNPRVDIFEVDWDISDDDAVDIHAEVGCSIVWSYLGDADQEAGELVARRCLTALIECLWADRTLGSVVKAVMFRAGSSGSAPEDERTRHVFVQDVTVLLQEVM